MHPRVAGEGVGGLLHHPPDRAIGHRVFGQYVGVAGHIAIERPVDGEQRARRQVVQPELLAIFEAEAVKLRPLVFA